MKLEWDWLPYIDQLKYIELMEKRFPDLSREKIEKKAKEYYESSNTMYK